MGLTYDQCIQVWATFYTIVSQYRRFPGGSRTCSKLRNHSPSLYRAICEYIPVKNITCLRYCHILNIYIFFQHVKITVYFNENWCFRRFYQANTTPTLPGPYKEASQSARRCPWPFQELLRNNNGDDVPEVEFLH